MKLVICEKNIAARRIAYILSDGKSSVKKIEKTPVYEFYKDGELWNVIGLRGHIVHLDFPRRFNNWNKINPRELVEAETKKRVTQKNIADALKNLVDKNPDVIIATDYDREGELIGVEAIDLLKKYNPGIKNIKRAKFSAITGGEIKKAFENLKDVDYNLSSAGETRQIIDLVWGAVLTRLISLISKRYGKDFLSIGRVQSPTLSLIVEREKEIKNFKPVPFWRLIAELKKGKTFYVEHAEGRFWDEKKAIDLYKKVEKTKEARVEEIDKQVLKESPPAPFNTTSFLQSASYFGLSAAKAMNLAEELYMAGLISYPRTDNTVYPGSLNVTNILEKLSKGSFSKEVEIVKNKMRKYPTRGKKKTTDHPPIHPVGIPRGKLKDEKKQIYELIVRRFLATFTKDAVSEKTKVTFDIKGEKFIGEGYRVVDPGSKEIYVYIKKKERKLPDLSEGENVEITGIKVKKDETKPPDRYTQGSLIALMEKLSLGTKSTRPEIINKLFQRKYITPSPLSPRPVATAVIDALKDYDVVKTKMTAELEKDMNLIAEGKKTLDQTIEESKKMLIKVIDEIEKNRESIRENISSAQIMQTSVGKCPLCGRDMVIRKNREGKRFVGCTGFPACKNTYSLPQKGMVLRTDRKCKKCGAPVVKIIMKGKKPWWLCLNPECSGKNSKPQG